MIRLETLQTDNYRAELDLIDLPGFSISERFTALSRFFHQLVMTVTSQDVIAFRNFYARFRYLLSAVQLAETERRNLDAFRRFVKQNRRVTPNETTVEQGVMLMRKVLDGLSGNTSPTPKGYRRSYFTDQFPPVIPADVKNLKVLCVSCSDMHDNGAQAHFILEAYDLDNMGELLHIYIRRYPFSDFTRIRTILAENAVLLLHNVSNSEKPNQYSTTQHSLLVLEPDFLVDASSVGECFSSEGTNAHIFFLSKLVENLPGAAALKGSMVGYYLDEMIREPKKDPEEIFTMAQRTNALKAARLGSVEMFTIKESIRREHLPKIRELIKKEGSKELWIEPTYFSSIYGLQGRLDLLAINRKLDAKDIIELKSGSPSSPTYSIAWSNHKMQVVCYDLLLKSTYGKSRQGYNAVFYSKCNISPYRNIVSEHAEWNQALNTRNSIVFKIYRLAGGDFRMLNAIKEKGIPSLPKYSETELARFQYFYDPGKIATQYYQELVAFTLREMINTKVGDYLREEDEQQNGFASLWLNDILSKEHDFRIIPDLTVTKIDKKEGHICMSMTRAVAHAFRKGDLVVVYPCTENGYNCLSQHILKGSVKELGLNTLTVAIYNKQTDYNFIQQHIHWAIEPDIFERNYWSVLSCLLNVIGCDDRKKKLLFGYEEPRFDNQVLKKHKQLTDNQHSTIQDALNAKDYYLLQGPPGTGKTSTFLVNYVRESLRAAPEKIVILAFTNNAVEKICESLKDPRNGAAIPYIRLGSKYVEDEFLFTEQLADDDADNWKLIIDDSRVIVSTVATFQNNQLLLKEFLPFKHLVVDEASQLTEAQLAGVLAAFDKFVLIGDHKQLPAIVTQHEKTCLVEDDGYLNRLNIKDLRTSLFERLIRNATAKAWTRSYGQLTDHYRMHEQIANLVANHYPNRLTACLPRQWTRDAPYRLPNDHSFFPVSISRTVFIESFPEAGFKRNVKEAAIVVDLVKMLIEKAKFRCEDIGIIAPFRAQVVAIKTLMPANWLKDDELIVDTVERFQGGQKKVIIFSTTITAPRQMNMIQNIAANDVDSTDRKLLVGLSRAEEQVIILGNPGALSCASQYQQLIAACKQNNGYLTRQFAESLQAE